MSETTPDVALDLQSLIPVTKDVQVNDEALTIKPFKFRDIKSVSEYVAIFQSNLGSSDDGAGLMQLAVDHSDEILEVIQLATGKDSAWAQELEMIHVIDLLGAIIEVNINFFSHLLVPRIKAMSERIAAGVK
jgi:hypothetical protein